MNKKLCKIFAFDLYPKMLLAAPRAGAVREGAAAGGTIRAATICTASTVVGMFFYNNDHAV